MTIRKEIIKEPWNFCKTNYLNGIILIILKCWSRKSVVVCTSSKNCFNNMTCVLTAEIQELLSRMKESESRAVASSTKLTILVEYFKEREQELHKYVFKFKKGVEGGFSMFSVNIVPKFKMF